MRTRLPGLAVAGIVLVAGAGALAQAEAERRLDAAIAQLRAALPPAATLTIGARRVDPVTGRATLADVVLVHGADRYAVAELILTDVSDTRIGRAEALRPSHRAADQGAMDAARILVAGLPLPAAGRPFDLATLAVEALEVEALAGQAPGRGSIRLDRLSLRDARRESLGAGTLEGLDFTGPGSDAQVFRLGRVALEGLVLPLAGDSFDPLAFRAARLAIERMQVRDPAQNVTFALGRLALQDWLPGRATALAVEGLQVSTPAAALGRLEFGLARFDAAGIDAAGTLAAVMQGVQIPDPLPGTPQRVQFDGVDATLDGQRVFTLGRLLTEGAMEGGLARGALVAERLQIIPPRAQAGVLEGLGYREVAGGIEIRGSAPRAGGRLEIAPLRIGWDNAATLDATAQIDGLPGTPAPGAPIDPDATVAQLAAARLAGLTLSLRDHGLLGRFYAQQARERRVPEGRVREEWAQIALRFAPPGQPPGRRGAPPAGAKDAPAAADPLAPMREAVARFMRQPGTLEVTLRPTKPLAFADIGALAALQPAEAVRLLGLSIVAR